MTELKQCPFCGEIPEIDISTSYFSKEIRYKIECYNSNCACMPTTSNYVNRENCIDDWNYREKDKKN